MPDSSRQYGLGDSTLYVRGVPRVIGRVAATEITGCPTCGSHWLYDIEIDVECPLLAGGKGVGRYIGCPACPFASPMIMVSTLT